MVRLKIDMWPIKIVHSRFSMQRVLNVEKEILLCSIRAETRAKSLVGEITFGGEKIQM